MPYVVMMSPIAQCGSRTDICGRIYPVYEAWARELAGRTGSGRMVSVEAGHEIYQTQLDQAVEEIESLLDDISWVGRIIRRVPTLAESQPSRVGGIKASHASVATCRRHRDRTDDSEVDVAGEATRAGGAEKRQRITQPAALGFPLAVAQRTGREAWKAAALPTELLPHRI